MEFTHEIIIPNEDLPFKMFLFEGGNGNFFREKHWHRSIEIFAVFEGSMKLFLYDKPYPLKSGQFILINSNEVHSIDAPGSNRTVVLQIALKTFEDYYSGDQFIQFSHRNAEYDSRVMELLKRIFDTYQKKEYGYALQVRGDYYHLLHLLVTAYRKSDVTQDMLNKNCRLNRLSTIINYMKENYKEELKLESVAEVFGYAPAYLSRMFQKYGGINYKDCLCNIRMEYAFKELVNTDHTISETALNNGFPNSKAFAREFRKKYGRLPSEYRRSGL